MTDREAMRKLLPYVIECIGENQWQAKNREYETIDRVYLLVMTDVLRKVLWHGEQAVGGNEAGSIHLYHDDTAPWRREVYETMLRNKVTVIGLMDQNARLLTGKHDGES